MAKARKPYSLYVGRYDIGDYFLTWLIIATSPEQARHLVKAEYSVEVPVLELGEIPIDKLPKDRYKCRAVQIQSALWLASAQAMLYVPQSVYGGPMRRNWGTEKSVGVGFRMRDPFNVRRDEQPLSPKERKDAIDFFMKLHFGISKTQGAAVTASRAAEAQLVARASQPGLYDQQ
jgi:hypothetical protein